MEDGELRQALAVLDTYNAQLEALTRQVQMLQMSLEETTKAREAFKALADAKEGDEILVPVGASSYIPVKISGKKSAIIGVGSKIAVEKDLDDAIEFTAANGNTISEALKKTVNALSDLERRAAELTALVQQEYSNRQIE
ncbi:MAG: prefoldin subunit alpha [Candidatus Methanoplasma sp.]|jgi:prefoldin alpha subunit|nr:prefoldin subunit alpha [Candidatus Methanoplasma sp.]